MPVSASAATVNRFCASGVESIAIAAERIAAGGARAVLAGGTESMSLVPMGGHKIAPNPRLVADYPDVYLSTGLVAENHAREASISREEQDEFAFESHQKAVAAIDAGRFADETITLTTAGRRGRSRSTKGRGAIRRSRRSRRSKPAFHAKGTVTAGQLLADQRRRGGGDRDG